MKTLNRILCMALLPVVSSAATIDVALDVSEKEHPINPMIYGQFIEHLGRCIYGGIWAEMLEDRKFYFPITEDYDPYKSLLDTAYPVVGASPWEIIGVASGVNMITENSFVGEHTPLIEEEGGIRQRDLAFVKGKNYNGYVWLKSADNAQAVVEVSLVCGEGEKMTQQFKIGNDDYAKYSFSWTAPEDTDKGIVEIRVASGRGLVGTVSLMPGDNIRGMRADTLKLLKELNSPIYRWPGGNFTSGYDWRDGVGDRDRRPPRKNPAWLGAEHNDFGTDEFIDFCREIGTEPMIAVNTGLGDAYSAAQWVEYCNASTDSVAGGWRSKNGNDSPYDVKYWCVGNEMWGDWQLGYMHLDHYVLKHNLTAKAMLAIDDSLVLVGSGDIKTRSIGLEDDHEERGWSEGLLQDCADNMDLISEHFYAGRTPWSDTQREDILPHVKRVKEFIKDIADQHRVLQANIPSLKGRRIPISMDEWNYWHRDYAYGELGCIYDLQDALGIAEGLHEFYRQSDIIQMAYYAQTVNVIGCIKTSKTDAEFATTGLVLKMYRAHYGNIPLKVVNVAEPFDIAAALDLDGETLVLSVVNPLQEEVTVNLSVKGAKPSGDVKQWWVTGDSAISFNTPGKSRQVDLYEASGIRVEEGLSVPALSCAIFRIPVK
jgi:alpha-L-arabinofuranosidase